MRINNRARLFITYVVLKAETHFLTSVTRKLSSAPEGVGLCSVIHHKYVDLFINTVLSFQLQTQLHFPIYLVSDGSLTPVDKKRLRSIFQITIKEANHAEKKMRKALKDYPYLSQFRFDPKITPLRVKLDPLLLNPFKKCIYLDSDILFFHPPSEVLEFIHGQQKAVLYSCRDEEVARTCIPIGDRYEHFFREVLFENWHNTLDPTFNSGLLCIADKKLFNLELLDKIAQYFFQVGYAYAYLAEETLLSFAFLPKSVQKLHPFKYANASFYAEYMKYQKPSLISMHYSGCQGLKTQFQFDAEHLFRKFCRELFLKRF